DPRDPPALCLLRSRYPDGVGCGELYTRDLSAERYKLQTRLLVRLGGEAQQILVVEYLLQLIEVGGETYRALQTQEERLAPSYIRQLGNAELSIGRFPVVAVQTAHTGSIDRVD